jgi:hypothetical protein
MGEAKRRKAAGPTTVYHHTSTLRTNLLWMSGVIKPEGQVSGALHPVLGEIKTDALMRRPMKDFPPLVWFTSQIAVPRCLLTFDIFTEDGGTRKSLSPAEVAGLSLDRVALGFPIADIPVMPWRSHPGFGTQEGRDLNSTARAVGDNPNDWWVAEEPIDILRMSEVWGAKATIQPKLKRMDDYLPHVRRMVQGCRDRPGVFIPPSWLTIEQGREIARRLGTPVSIGGE